MKNSKDHSGIAHQNKDIVSKTLGDGMQGKPLSVMGWETDLVIERIEPTNLPAVEANEMRLDNLFVLNDGSIAVIDYESTAKAENVLKYLGYVVRILRRIGIRPDTKIRVMILYTADVEYAETDYDVGCLQFHVENAHMIGIDSEKWLMQAKENIACQEFSFETQMHLIMLPLTYKGSQAKNDAIATCVELASKIEDMHTQNFVLAGILTFTDKIISEEMRKAIERRIRMTKIGASLMETGRQEGQAQSLTASVESVMKELSVSLERACQIVGTTVGAYDDARKLLGR